jgi:hypothetical protein
MAWTASTICRSKAPSGKRARAANWSNSRQFTRPRLQTPTLATVLN